MSIIVNPVKVGINQECFTMAQGRAVRAYAREVELNFDNEDLERAARFYADSSATVVHDVSFQVTGNLYHLAPDLLADESGKWHDPFIDCWATMLVECPFAIYRIGFYIGDFNQLVTEGVHRNVEKVLERAFIRKFVAVEG